MLILGLFLLVSFSRWLKKVTFFQVVGAAVLRRLQRGPGGTAVRSCRKPVAFPGDGRLGRVGRAQVNILQKNPNLFKAQYLATAKV